jgi:hypothetical protein
MTKPTPRLTLRGQVVVACAVVTLGWLFIRAFAYLMQFISNNLGA